MKINRSNRYGYLDRIRITNGNNGIEKCKAVFRDILKTNRSKASTYINDSRLTFTSMYILLPEIETFDLYHALNSRNMTVIQIIDQILKPENKKDDKNILSDNNKNVYSALKWILETGQDVVGLNREYDEIIDIVVSVLINRYQDKDILPVVVEIIFQRHRKGLHIHDLVWALFRTHDQLALKLIAKRIHSADRNDAELAHRLLGIEVKDAAGMGADCKMEYSGYLKWMEENQPFLYFTGESFQFSSKPVFCRVDMERKYMYKKDSSNTCIPVSLSNDGERRILEAFKQLSDEDKDILSEYSFKIHKRNTDKWKKWIHSPIEEQIRTAKNERGRFL